MKQKQSMFLTVLPSLMLLGSSLYLLLTDLFHLPPYLMLCISGLMALCACLLAGSGLYARMLTDASRGGVGAVSLLLTLWAAFYFLSGLLAAHAAAVRVLSVLCALPPLLIPAFLFRAFHGARLAADRQSPGLVFRLLLGLGLLGSVLSLLSLAYPLLFRFSDGMPVYSAGMGAVFFFYCILSLGCQVYALVPALQKPARLVPPLLVLLLETGVFTCMAPGVSLLPAMLLPYAAPLFLFTDLELLVATGLLPDGRQYPDLLRESLLPVQVMDRDGTILFGCDHAVPVTSGHKSSILSNRYHVSLNLGPDTQLTAAVIRGGYALCEKDLRDQRALEGALAAVTKEVEESGRILSQEHGLERELQDTTRKNAFFARQELKIQEKTVRASVLLRCAAATAPEPGFRRAVVTKTNVLLTYVQQLGLLLQEARENGTLPISLLGAALDSSAAAFAATGGRCRVYHVAQGFYPADVVLTLYDLQELLLEDLLALGLPDAELRLRNEQNGLRLVTAVKNGAGFPSDRARLAALGAEAGVAVRVTEDEGTVSVLMEFLKGGGDRV